MMARRGDAGPDRLETLLDAWAVPPMRPDLRRRLLSIPAREPHPAGRLAGLARWLLPWMVAGGFATAAAAGMVVGAAPVGGSLAQALSLEPAPEDEWVAMLDDLMEESLQ